CSCRLSPSALDGSRCAWFPFALRGERQLVVVVIVLCGLEGTERAAEPCECLCFELADSLAGQLELGADLLQRLRVGIDAEAELEDPALTLGKVGECLQHRSGAQGVLGELLRAIRGLIGEQVAELVAVVVSDWR